MRAAAGGCHTAAITDDANLWMWGWNACGQLGLGDVVDRREPVVVVALAGVVATVACGGAHTIALCATCGEDDGPGAAAAVFAWGAGGAGQLGLLPSSAEDARGGAADGAAGGTDAARRSSSFDSVAAVPASPAAGGALAATTAAAAATAAAGGLGDSSGAVAGAGTPLLVEPEAAAAGPPPGCETFPRAVACGSGVTAVACGSFHTAFLGEDGVVYMAGDDSFGQLGRGGVGVGVGGGRGGGGGERGARMSLARVREDSYADDVATSGGGLSFDADDDAAASVSSAGASTPQPAGGGGGGGGGSSGACVAVRGVLSKKIVRVVACGGRHTLAAVETQARPRTVAR